MSSYAGICPPLSESVAGPRKCNIVMINLPPHRATLQLESRPSTWYLACIVTASWTRGAAAALRNRSKYCVREEVTHPGHASVPANVEIHVHLNTSHNGHARHAVH
jgi:hypothetical protein